MALKQFPLTSNGTIDWNFVFEDPADGFVPGIQNSETPDILRKNAVHIAQALYTRNGDELRLKKLLSWIENVVPENADDTANLPKMKESILKLVRDLKTERISLADRYVEKRSAVGKAPTPSDRRDSDKSSDGPTAKYFSVAKSFYVLAVLAVAVLVYLAYGV